MVMIYPREGSIAHNHSANLVQAPWVTAEQRDAAQRWISFLLEENNRKHSSRWASARPPTSRMPTSSARQFGLDPSKPTRTINPDTMKPAVAMQDRRPFLLGEVKKPGIAVFVVDTSGSMAGEKLRATKDGLALALDDMAQQNSVGLVTFSNGINATVGGRPS